MNSVINCVCGAMNFMPPWLMIGAFSLIVLSVILFIIFKGIKRGVKFIILALIIISGAYLAYLCYQFKDWSAIELATFFISWGPTILFVFIVMTATFVNAKRGLRKSLILALHAVCAGALCVAFFFICTSVKEVDSGFLSFINLFLGEGGLQRTLGVSEELTGFKEVLVEAIPQFVGTESDFGILISSNTAYLYTLVDMIFKVAIAILSFLIYFPLIFILYIVYLLCYSQRKYKRTKIAEFQNGMTDRTYKKHHLGGGCVGLVRGLAVGLLCMSFMGSALFMVAGGKGEGTLDEYDYGKDEVNKYFNVYRSIESYGAQGIFKVLNALSDATDTPYYLFAADIIFSGELNDEEAGISGDIKFREEFGALTGFARDTFELLMKYGEEELTAIINGEGGEGAFDTILDVMSKTDFRYEFDELIDAFDSQTYVINLSLSLVNSIVDNIETLSMTSSIGDDEKDLLQLLFKKGYLSASIPDERKLLAEGGAEVRPYLNVSHLIEKKDIKIALNLALSLISEEYSDDSTMTLIQRIVPQISQLSLLSDGRKEEIDPVIGRLYCLVENKYLTAEGQDGISYSDIAGENIDWIGEINALIGITDDVIDLTYNMWQDGTEGIAAFTYLFYENNPKCDENSEHYDNICSAVTDSKILGKVLASSLMYEQLLTALQSVAPDVYLPKDINYANTYDEEGNLVEYGETYQLLYGLKLLASCQDPDLVNKILAAGDNIDMEEMLGLMSEVVKLTDGNKTLPEYLTDSQILRSTLSVSLIMAAEQGDSFYVPLVSREKDEDGNIIPVINKPELKQLLENMDELVRFVMPFTTDGGDLSDVDDFLDENGTFYKLVVENRIFEGTVAQILNKKLPHNVLVVPKALNEDIDGWLTVDGKAGELIKLLDAFNAAGFTVQEMIDGSLLDSETVLEKLIALTENGDNLETFLKSNVMHYTVSDYLLGDGLSFGDFAVVVPYAAQQRLQDDIISAVVKKSELTAALEKLKALGLTEETEDDAVSAEDVLAKIAKNKDVLTGSYIVTASVVNTVIVNGFIELPVSLQSAGAREELLYYDSDNPWNDELTNLINALDLLLGLSGEEEVTFTEEALLDAINDVLTNFNEKADTFDECYKSEIFRFKITNSLDDVLAEKVVPTAILSSAKSGGYYTGDELHSLMEALNVFGVEDVLNIESDALVQDVKDRVPAMNEPLQEYGGRSTLDVIYPSKIISYLISDELDKALLNGETPLIESVLLANIKNYNTVYEKDILSSFIDAVNELNLGSLDDIELGYDDLFSFTEESATHEGMTKLDVIYSSDLAAGIITKAVKDKIAANNVLCDHPYAYETRLKIFRKSEIESIIDVIDNSGDEVSVNLANICENFYGEDGKPNSYILVATVSDMLLESKLIIPPAAIETVSGVKYILPSEIKNVVEVFTQTVGDGGNDVNEWSDVEFNIPDPATEDGNKLLENIYASEIMRARIVYQLADTATEDILLAANAADGGKAFEDQSNHEELKGKKRTTVSENQLRAVVDAILALNAGGSDGETEFKMPDFTPQIISNYSIDTLNKLYQSDIIWFEVCRVVISAIENNGYISVELQKQPVTAVDLRTGETMTCYTLTPGQVEELKVYLSASGYNG